MALSINQKDMIANQPAMGLNQPVQLQNVDPAKIQQGVTQNSALKGVASGSEKNAWLTPVLTVPTFIAMGYGMDKFNHACRGEYADSVVGKVTNWGERVGNNSFFQSAPMKKFEKFLANTKNFTQTKVINKSKILSSMFNTPSSPENRMVKMMKTGTVAEISTDAIQKLEEHLKAGGKLKFKDGTEVTEKILEKMGKESHTEETIKQVIDICENNKDVKVASKRFGKIPGSKKIFKGEVKYLSDFKATEWLGKALGREVQLSEYTNKIAAFRSTNKTWLGKTAPKAMIRLIEGLTNGTAGGKFAILMGAFFVADAFKKTFDAPKGEKTETFAENLIYNEAMYLTMPLGLKIMHGLGGLQYMGIPKDKVEAFRKELAEFNEKVKTGQIKDQAVYKTEKARIKKILDSSIDIKKGEGFGKGVLKGFRNIVNKPLQWAAKAMTVGLENFEGFNPKGINAASSLSEKAGHFFKTGRFVLKNKTGGFKWALGGPTRFIFYLMVIAPPLGKLGAKMSHVLFGKPTVSVLDEGKEPEAQKQNTPTVIMPNQAVPVAQGVQNVGQPALNKNLANNMQPQGLKTNNMVPTEPQTPKRYIPSSDGFKADPNYKEPQKGIIAPEINIAMNKAEKTEQSASRYLK